MELPSIQKNIYDVFDSSDVIIVSFAQRGSANKIKNIAANRGLQFRLVTDAYDLFKQFNVKGVPLTIIIDRQGVIRYKQNKYLDEKTVGLVKNLINENKNNSTNKTRKKVNKNIKKKKSTSRIKEKNE
ncbi:MAG: hypothetical protein ABII23_03615 [bacterium]